LVEKQPMAISQELVLPATPESIGVARQAVARFGAGHGLSTQGLDRLRLAVTEAVSNVVRHAYGPDGGPVEIVAELESDDLLVIVRDEGRGLGNAAAGSPGFGLRLMQSVAATCDLSSQRESGTEVRMTFRIADSRPAL
jgi:serine/threonine-protein kinase RsbW